MEAALAPALTGGRRFAAVLALAGSVALPGGCRAPHPLAAPTAPAATAPDDAIARASEAHRARYRRFHVAALPHRRFSPQEYWRVLSPILAAGAARLRVSEVGRSLQGRPLRRVDFGHGPEVVLVWSQMHGDESTASRALVDLFNYLGRADDPLVKRLEERVHLVALPLLNPDGAERFVRHNAAGVDINRDARRLATPEGRALQRVRDEVRARWGFNLHDQNVRTRLGDSGRDVLISLLAPPPAAAATSPANLAARRICSLLAAALAPVVGDQVARYDEEFNPRAFGDLMTRQGTSVVLIESGGELADPDKERLREANFVALLSALEAIADDSWLQLSERRYLNLPRNAPWIYDLILRGARVAVAAATEPVAADIAINYGDTLARTDGTVVEVGDLADARALEVVDVEGLYYLPPTPTLAIGGPADALLARERDGSRAVWCLQRGRLLPAADDPGGDGCPVRVAPSPAKRSGSRRRDPPASPQREPAGR